MTTNPFVPPKPVEPPPEVEVGDVLFNGAVVMKGPESPDVAPQAHPQGPRWPKVEVDHTSGLCVMGLHGGSGATTVAALLGDKAVLTGSGWPVAAGWERPRPVLDVIAVCRNHHKGIAAGSEFARQWADGQLPDSNLIGIVIVDDGPKLLNAQSIGTRALARMTAHGWHLRWHEPWRIEPVNETNIPRSANSVRRSILRTHEKIVKKRSRG